MIGMAVPEPFDTTHLSYSVVAIVLTQVMLRNEQAPKLRELIYRGLGAVSVISLSDLVAQPDFDDLQRCSNHPELGSPGRVEHTASDSTPGKGAIGGRRCVDGRDSGIPAHWADSGFGDERRGNNPAR